jgi:hypothetical protein
MSLTPPCPAGQKGRPAAVLALPPDDAWPASDTLITRRQLAELYGVTVKVIRAWERRGKGPPKFAQPPRDGFSEVLYLCADARDWLLGAIAAQNETAVVTPPSPAEPVAPVIDHRVARKAKAIAHVQQLESQRIEDERAQNMGSDWCALAEVDEPFASNVVTRSRPARYWGS